MNELMRIHVGQKEQVCQILNMYMYMYGLSKLIHEYTLIAGNFHKNQSQNN